ncbi:hypothetical protein PTI98_008634 [Pleurotus ostreatus]|nr:hypothetical protein PTI98_008634 [Pleurotus ostreatus]
MKGANFLFFRSLPVAAQQLYDKLPAKRKKMVTYPGARHELHNVPDGVKEESLLAIINFIRTICGFHEN